MYNASSRNVEHGKSYMMNNKNPKLLQTITFAFIVLSLIGCTATVAEEGWTKLGIDAWHNGDKWDVAGDAMLNPDTPKLLLGKPGKGILINGKIGKCPSLVTNWRR